MDNNTISIQYIDLLKLQDRSSIFSELQPLINDNLVINGGTLIKGNLLEGDYDWRHLFIARQNEKIVGFSILRYSNYDQHKTGYDEYYYISDVVVPREFQHKGIGSQILKEVLISIASLENPLPVVASVKKTNAASLRLFNKYFKKCGENDSYDRFIDQMHYTIDRSQNELSSSTSIKM